MHTRAHASIHPFIHPCIQYITYSNRRERERETYTYAHTLTYAHVNINDHKCIKYIQISSYIYADKHLHRTERQKDVVPRGSQGGEIESEIPGTWMCQ